MKERLEQSERLRFAFALVLGAVIFLWTDDPVPGVLLASLQAGWSSLLTGWWLWQVDANRSRALSCLLFHIATASWQAAAAALVSVLTMMFAQAFFGQALNVSQFETTMIALLMGVLGSVLLGVVALAQALASGNRVWCHPQLRRRLLHSSPTEFVLAPSGGPGRQFNHAVFVVATTCVTPAVLVGFAILLLTAVTAEDPPLAPVIAGGVTIVGAPLLMIVVNAWLSRRIIAQTPEDCWAVGVIPRVTGPAKHWVA